MLPLNLGCAVHRGEQFSVTTKISKQGTKYILNKMQTLSPTILFSISNVSELVCTSHLISKVPPCLAALGGRASDRCLAEEAESLTLGCDEHETSTRS